MNTTLRDSKEIKPLILEYLKKFKLFKCLADNPNFDDILNKFFEKIVYKKFK